MPKSECPAYAKASARQANDEGSPNDKMVEQASAGLFPFGLRHLIPARHFSTV
jgi:hypothetical protein